MRACQKGNFTSFHNLFSDLKNSFGKYRNYDAKIIEFSKIKKIKNITNKTFAFTQKLVTVAKMLVCMSFSIFLQIICICVEKFSSLNFSRYSQICHHGVKRDAYHGGKRDYSFSTTCTRFNQKRRLNELVLECWEHQTHIYNYHWICSMAQRPQMKIPRKKVKFSDFFVS